MKKIEGMSTNPMCLVLLFAVIVGGFLYITYEPATFSIIRDDYWYDRTNTDTTTTPYTTTEPDDGIPDDGTWFYLKVMFTWADWVNPADYCSIIIGVTDAGYVGLDEHTFLATQEDTWYTFPTFIVELSGDVYIYMMGGDYVTENVYNAASAGYYGGYWNFWDSGAPMPIGPAGFIYYEWVEA